MNDIVLIYFSACESFDVKFLLDCIGHEEMLSSTQRYACSPLYIFACNMGPFVDIVASFYPPVNNVKKKRLPPSTHHSPS